MRASCCNVCSVRNEKDEKPVRSRVGPLRSLHYGNGLTQKRSRVGDGGAFGHRSGAGTVVARFPSG